MKGVAAAFIGLFWYWNLSAQDTVVLRSMAAHEYSRSAVAGYYTNPAAAPFRFKHNLSVMQFSHQHLSREKWMAEQGNKERMFKLHAESFRHIDSNNLVWGYARYANGVTSNIRGNETSDLPWVYPYLMADSMGGNLRWEEYRFGGGYNRKIQQWHAGIFLDYRARQAYSSKDPRPKNTVSQPGLSAGLSRQVVKNYMLSINGTAGLYSQENLLSFLNPLGKPIVHHVTGLGGYNHLFSGSHLEAYYQGSFSDIGYAVYSQSGTGWLHYLKAGRTAVDKTIRSIQSIPLSQLSSESLETALGYVHKRQNHFVGGFVHYNSSTHTGRELRYDYRGGNNYELLTTEKTYQRQQQQYEAMLTAGRNLTRLSGWQVTMVVHKWHQEAQQAQLDRSMVIDGWRYRINAGWQQKIARSYILFDAAFRLVNIHRGQLDAELSNRYLDAILLGNYRYFSADYREWSGLIKWIQPVNRNFALYIQAAAELTKYEDGMRNTYITCTGGIYF